jgi:DNA-binding NarL/FixJ family response regulator
MQSKIRIILVDDELLLLESLEIILSINADIEIVGKAKDGNEALKLLNTIETDMAIVDLNMVGMGGIQLIKEIKLKYPTMKVLVLTTFYDESNITSAIRNGANGYLLKDSGRAAILDAIHNVMNGQSVLDGKVMETLSVNLNNNYLDLPKTNVILEKLTKRECEICTMIAEGYTNAQISSFLFISEGTVKNYMTSIYDKTNIHDRTALAVKLSKEMGL